MKGTFLRALYLVVTSRLRDDYRLHSSLGEQSGAGKSELPRFVLSTLPISVVIHLGGGMSKRALQYAGDLSHLVVFIDEANDLDPEMRALFREAMTRPEVARLVTGGDLATGFEAKKHTVRTGGMVLIQAGTAVVADPADETRMLMLHPDASQEQTERILDRQAVTANTFRPDMAGELAIWRRAQELLQPCIVLVPYASALRQFFPAEMRRTRRDFPRLLSLIRAHACLYQYQRTSYEQEGILVVAAEFEDYRSNCLESQEE